MRRVRALLRLALALTGLYGLYVGLSRSGIEHMLYYTYQSNVLCVLSMLFFGIAGLSGRTLRDWKCVSARGCAAMAITVTGLVYHFLLRPKIGMAWTADNLILHYVMPFGALIDFIVPDDAPAPRFRDVPAWLTVPLLYFAFAMLASGAGVRFDGDRYPYFFLDVSVLGVAGVARWVVLLAAAFVVMSLACVGLTRFLRRALQRSGKCCKMKRKGDVPS